MNDCYGAARPSKRSEAYQVGPRDESAELVAQALPLADRLLPVADALVVVEAVVLEVVAVRQLAARQGVQVLGRRRHDQYVVEPAAIRTARRHETCPASPARCARRSAGTARCRLSPAPLPVGTVKPSNRSTSQPESARLSPITPRSIQCARRWREARLCSAVKADTFVACCQLCSQASSGAIIATKNQ
jgi:hypothetical protein